MPSPSSGAPKLPVKAPDTPHFSVERVPSQNVLNVGKNLNLESVRGFESGIHSQDENDVIKNIKSGDALFGVSLLEGDGALPSSAHTTPKKSSAAAADQGAGVGANLDAILPIKENEFMSRQTESMYLAPDASHPPSEHDQEAGYEGAMDSFNQKRDKRSNVGQTRMMREMWPERIFVAAGMFALLLSSLMNLITPLILGRMVDYLSNRRFDDAKNLILAVVVISGAMAVCNFANMSLLWIAGHKVTTRLRLQLFKCIQYREIPFFDSNRSGDLLSRVNSDVYAVNTAQTSEQADMVHRTIMFLGSLAYMFYLSWDLTLISICMAPLLGYMGHRLALFFHSIARMATNESARATVVAEESISSIRTIKAQAQERSMLGRFWDHVQRMYVLSRKQSLAKAGQRSFVYCVGTLAVAFVLWLGAVRVQDGVMTAGGLLTFVLLSLQVGEKSGQVQDNYGQLKAAAGASNRAFQLIDQGERRLRQQEGARKKIPNGQYNQRGEKVGESDTVMAPLALTNVFFEYPTRPGKPVLRDLTLVLRPGSTVALVGPSGGGKSSIIGLIERYYRANRGTVTWGGVDVNELDHEFFHKHVGYVGQEPVLFCTTVRDNVLFGASSRRCELEHDSKGMPIVKDDTIQAYDYQGRPLRQKDVEDACRMAFAHDFVMQWPDGYDTVVGESTKTLLSGGQKQRLAIARCILMNPPILILDEATSALDNKSEGVVQAAQERLMEGKSTLLIAHRLSTTRNADMVCVVQDGRVVESGSPDELQAQPDSFYARSYRANSSKGDGQGEGGYNDVVDPIHMADHMGDHMGDHKEDRKRKGLTIDVEKPSDLEDVKLDTPDVYLRH